MKLTVITSVFNSDDFLDHFIQDIKRQSMFKECEFFFLDANSQDNSRNIILEQVCKYKNIQYFNVGDKNIYSTWNLGVILSKTEYLTNWNTDDRRLPHSLEKQINFLESNKDIDLCYGKTLWENIPNRFAEDCDSNIISGFDDPTFEKMLVVNSPHCMPVWRKTIHNKYGLFDDSFFSAGDYEMWMRAISRGSKFSKMDEFVGSYYRNPKGISSNEETLPKAIEEVLKIRNFYKNET